MGYTAEEARQAMIAVMRAMPSFRDMMRIPPLVPTLTARPLAAIQRDIDRAAVPAMRAEDC